MIHALFVDGVGRTRRMAVDYAQPRWLFPRHREMTCSFYADSPPSFAPHDHHQFDLLFHRDSFAIYGFHFDTGPQYKTLAVSAEWAYHVSGGALPYIWNEQERQMAEYETLARSAVVRIADFIRPDIATGITKRECFFVARHE